MPYGDLREQIWQRYETYADLDRYKCTIEEREEYEPHIDMGNILYAGVDYQEILTRAEKEADIILWDGGNNDLPFYKPDLHIVVTDPHRAGHEMTYYPGEANLRMADVVVIINTTPLFAALLSAIFLKERTSLRTWIAILVAFGGIAVIFAGSLGGGTMPGNIMALGGALFGAGGFVVIRRKKEVNMIPALVFSGLIAFLVSVPFARPFLITSLDLTVFAFAGLIILPVSFTLVTMAPRYITAPEVGLMMLLNTVEAPMLVWLFIGEAPRSMTFLGGAIIVGALVVHFVWGERQSGEGKLTVSSNR